MKALLRFIIVSMFLYSCTESSKPQYPEERGTDTLLGEKDSIKILRKVITNELAGSNYRKRAMLYFLVKGNDTSDFKCYVTESLEGKVGLELRFSPSMTYRQQTVELGKLLSEASGTFQLDSLHTIFIGRLISTGDLAIYVSRYYKGDRKPVSEFLGDPSLSLAADFNIFLRKYSRYVKSVSIEKMLLVDKEQLYSMSKIESDSATIPNTILDGLIWMKIGPRSEYE